MNTKNKTNKKINFNYGGWDANTGIVHSKEFPMFLIDIDQNHGTTFDERYSVFDGWETCIKGRGTSLGAKGIFESEFELYGNKVSTSSNPKINEIELNSDLYGKPYVYAVEIEDNKKTICLSSMI